jgi:hypothetical protein
MSLGWRIFRWPQVGDFGWPSGAVVGEAEPELFVKGCQIIEYAGELCHLSCRKYSFAIRHIRNGAFVEICRGVKDRKKYLELKDKIRIVRKAPRKPIADMTFWVPLFQSIAKASR